MNDPTLVRCVAITDEELRFSILSFDEMLEVRGIDPNKPYRGRDAGNGMHVYMQTLEDVVKGELP